jgi:hypothetical protein
MEMPEKMAMRSILPIRRKKRREDAAKSEKTADDLCKVFLVHGNLSYQWHEAFVI